VQPRGHGRIVAPEVLALAAARQVAGGERLEADEEAAKSGLGGAARSIAAQNGVDGGGALEQPLHPSHPAEEIGGKARIAQQMIVEEIEMASGKPIDLRQRIVDTLGEEGPAAVKKASL